MVHKLYELWYSRILFLNSLEWLYKLYMYFVILYSDKLNNTSYFKTILR